MLFFNHSNPDAHILAWLATQLFFCLFPCVDGLADFACFSQGGVEHVDGFTMFIKGFANRMDGRI